CWALRAATLCRPAAIEWPSSTNAKAGLRRLLKFLHTMGATGLIGAMACLLVLILSAPTSESLAEHAQTYVAMDRIGSWILFPSLAITLISGLLAIAWNRAFHNAGWAWIKLLTGVSLFEGGLVGVQGPIKEEAERSVAALASHAAGPV